MLFRACASLAFVLLPQPAPWLDRHCSAQIVRMAMAQFGTLTSYIRIASSSCVACFVMESRDGMKVVSMGSGTGYYTNEFAPEDPRAEMVMDGHAEVS